MSTLTDIGFHAKGDEQINDMIVSVLPDSEKLDCEGGFYLRYSDPSGAEMYLQGNASHEMIGFNPHLRGDVTNNLLIKKSVQREASELDGGFLAEFEDPSKEKLAFVFDAPDFKTIRFRDIQFEAKVQLVAFATNDFTIEDDIASRFRPVDLPNSSEPPIELSAVRPAAEISGRIRKAERRINKKTGHDFFALEVEVLGLTIYVAVDPFLVTADPSPGQWVSGGFWLSGRMF